MTAAAPDPPSLPEIVAGCLARMEDEGSAALDACCAEHPELAARIRERVGALVAAGFVEADDAGAAQPPERLAGFRLIRPLGGGGMGVVYLAEQLELGREVALKLVRPELLYFDGARTRFAREVEAVARLRHPGIVPVHAAGEDQGVPYLAMERVEGVSLARALEELADRAPARLRAADLSAAVRRALIGHGEAAASRHGSSGSSPDDSWSRGVVRLGVQAADALQHAHERGVLHRDVKPSNLMVTPARHVLLVDFGLALADGDARLTNTGSPLGSLAYMAPEQVRGSKQVDARTDVYGLGVTLYELLALRPPYATESHELLRQQILDGRPPALRTINPGVSLELATVVMTAMDPDPARRYASAAALRDDLSAVLERRSIRARPPGPGLRLRRWMQRRPATAVALALGSLLLLGAPITWALAQREANRELRAALDRESMLVRAERDANLRTADALQRANAHLDDALQAVAVVADLARTELEFVPGLGETRRRLLEQAADFAQRISEREGDSPDVLSSSARAALRVGVIRLDLGDYTAARPALERASVRARQLLAAQPGDPAGLEVLARATSELGTVENAVGSPEAGEARRAEAAELFERWRAVSGDPSATAGLAQLEYRRSVFCNDRGQLDGALDAAERAVVMGEQALAVRPDDRGVRAQLALSLSTCGESLGKLGRHGEAEAPLRRALELQAALRESWPEDTFVAHATAMSHVFMGRTLDQLQRYDEAQQHFERSFALFGIVRERAPDTPMMRAPLFAAYSSFGAMQARRGDPHSAAEYLLRSIQVLDEELARPEPLPRLRGDRGMVLLTLGILLRDNRDYANARRVLGEAIADQHAALRHDPGNLGWTRSLFNQHWTRGLVELETGDFVACAADARRLHEFAGDDQTSRRIALGLLARAAAGVDDPERAAALTDECFDWLGRMIDGGWVDLADLTGNVALEALRGDARFSGLAQRLGASAP